MPRREVSQNGKSADLVHLRLVTLQDRAARIRRSRADGGALHWVSSSLPEVGGPKIHTRGSGIDDAAFSSVVPPKLVDALERAASDGVTDTHALRQLSRWVIGK